MARAKPDPTPAQSFLAPLARLAARDPAIEALVFWHAGEGHSVGWPTEPTEELESEEIAFYAEGLLDEGFSLHWRIMAEASAPGLPEHIQLWLSQGTAPPPPDAGPDWRVLDSGHWPEPPK
jgi:hypothetical protein